MSGVVSEELEISKKRPRALGYLWTWYQDLQWSSPLTYTEVANWAALTKREPTVFEIGVLMNLDKHYRNSLCQTT